MSYRVARTAGRGPGPDGSPTIEGAVDAVRTTDPLVLALAALATIVLAVVVWWLFRRLYPASPGVRLKRELGKRDTVTVLMHPNPDPDAMSCAMGVAEIAASAGTDAVLQYPGEIRHQENRAFRTVLDLDLDRIESADELASDAVVLVDHNTPRGFTGAQMVEPIVVVDHHPGNGSGSELTDVRTEYGAASTIVTEYLREVGATFDGDGADETVVVSPELATGLLYGVQSDTNHLTKGCSAADFDACAFLFPQIDETLLNRIANPQVSDDVLQVKADAITNKHVEGSFAICDVGEVGNVDAIPQAADELLHLEGVTAVVIFGEYDGTLHLSGRSRDDRVHMGETLRHVVSDIPMANAGGHARMGGGQLSVDHMNGIGPAEGIGKSEFEERLFSALTGER